MFPNLTTRVCAALLAGWAAVAIVPATASAQLSTLGLHGWQVASSAQVGGQGSRISRPGFATASWLPVRPDDAGAPGTEIEALLQNGACPNVFYSTNMKTCFGYMTKVGPDTIAQFTVPWWFRTDFQRRPGANAKRAHHQRRRRPGRRVGERHRGRHPGHRRGRLHPVQSSTSRGLVTPGTNALALKVYPNNPNKMFTLDNVDWTQIPPDNNTGIQFPVQLTASGGARDRQRPRRAAQRRRPEQLGPDVVKAEVTNITRAAPDR